jgi:hypothetical protein
MRGREGRNPIATSPVNKEIGPMNAPDRPRRNCRAAALAILCACAALLAGAIAAPLATAAYGINNFDATFTNQDGTPATQAGSHPYQMTTSFGIDYTGEIFAGTPEGDLKDMKIELPAGFIGDATAMPKCATLDFITRTPNVFATEPECPDETAVGVNAANVLAPYLHWPVSVYNLETSPGVPVRLGFMVLGVTVVIDVGVKTSPEHNVKADALNAPQPINVYGTHLVVWGDPGDPSHDPIRGHCLAAEELGVFEPVFPSRGSSCPGPVSAKPFLTLPTSCTGPATISYESASWQEPDNWVKGSVLTHDNADPPNPQGFTGCGKLGFSPRIESQATSDSAETGTGIDFSLSFDDEGLTNPDGIAQSQLKKAVTTLPEGLTINPSIGEGLGVCSPADLDRETLAAEPGQGCPNASKIGTVQVDTPLVDEPIQGSVFQAQQDDPTTPAPGAENPFDSLLAFYIVLKNTDLGVLVKIPAIVEPDPKTGQLAVTVDNAPQIPFSSFSLHFREGQRAALVTPPACGTYTTEAELYPWSDPANPRTVTSSFEITQGVGDGPCPSGGVPPFHPQFEAGAVNNNAGSFSPFNMRLIRSDGEQDMTKFSSILPPGQLGSLKGVGKCPDAAVDAAKAKTGRQELAGPSCPADSYIGRTSAGAGVGGALTYVGGKVYLAGPYKGAPLSVISITPAVAGPFDAGTVVVRLGLDLNPKTAEVEVDGAASDPIPHILKGIVLKVRDLRVYVDRPNFTLNPTSCDESSVKATLFGSYLDVFSPADDVPAELSTRYQAANCLNLGFKPKLDFKLRGGTKRGGFPALTATYKPRAGDANVKSLVVRLPRSAFLEQGHIRTICTRVQFAADACPKGAQYGFIKAWTPLLDEPLAGPVYLRSSSHKLPDLVFDLHGLVDVEVATRIDSFKGGIRAKVESAPDAPLSKVVLRMQGAKKGLIVNSRNLCGAKSKADVQISAHNGKESSVKPVMRAVGCGDK